MSTAATICQFELAYQARRPATWLYFVALFVCTFIVAGEPVQEYARADGSVTNGPFIVAVLMLFGGTLSLLVSAGVSADAATRDTQTGLEALVLTTPVTTRTYLAGRFLAAFTLSALLLLAVPLALLAMAAFSRNASDLMAPFRVGTYLTPCLMWLVPNLFVTTAVLFAFAALTRRGLGSYLGALLLLCICGVSWGVLARTSNYWTVGALFDPFGAVVLDELSMRWTPAERSARLVPMAGVLLWNRLFWTMVGIGALVLTFGRFRRSRPSIGGRRSLTRAEAAPITERPAILLDVPRLTPRFGFDTRVRQLLAVAVESAAMVMVGWGGLALLLVAAFVIYSGLPIAHLGVPLVTTTERLISFLAAPLTRFEEINGMVVPLLVVFLAGELVWRERDVRLNPILDAAPVPTWVLLSGKLLALAMIVTTLQGLLLIGGVVVQLRDGSAPVDLGLYVVSLFGVQLIDAVLFATLALASHVLVNHKYVGHLAGVVAYLCVVSAPALGVRHRLLIYGADPGWDYSDMRGFEPFVSPWVWVKSYWMAWAFAIALLAVLFWVRGTESGLGARLTRARRGLTSRMLVGLAAAGLLVLATGGVVFYNTNVLKTYERPADVLARRAEYERRYGQYRGVPQPRVTGHTLSVALYPHEHRASIHGVFTLVNDGTAPISMVHVAPRPGVQTTGLRFDRPAKATLTDTRLSHHIYDLDTPLAPGETTQLQFEVTLESRGFANDVVDASIVSNGTALAGDSWLPAIGYQSERELQAAAARQAHGLAPRPMVARLEDASAPADASRGARVRVDSTVSTDTDQVAIAPGRLVRTWTTPGRRHSQYATDAPIRNDYVFFSAAYAVRRAGWNDVAIEVWYHPAHAANVDRMIDSVRASLAYLTEVLGPYPHRQLRLIERPGNAVLLHASPINIYYEEPFALLNPDADPRAIDLVYAVVAHEVAHQWWGNMLIPADVEGAALLTETLAWDSALGVVERTRGTAHLMRLLDMMRDAYLTPRAYAQEPLVRATDAFLAYRKGPFAMQALRQAIGSAPVDAALRTLVDTHASDAPPLATSLDLYRALETVTPTATRPLLADLFLTNTFWHVAVREARAKRLADGQWQVTLDVDARKSVVEANGVETNVPMDGPIAVGALGGGAEPVLHTELRRVRTGRQRISFAAPFRPVKAGIDPQHQLIDTNGDDNVKDVVVDTGPQS